jgi:NAD(P)-dependent dehydrogenase (short-subunit alcohol dehydrogenase family)
LPHVAPTTCPDPIITLQSTCGDENQPGEKLTTIEGRETGGTTLGQMQAEDYRADGVRVLITGATSGLGAAMAAALLDAGAVVAITGRDPDRCARAAADLTARHGGRAVGVGIDVRDESEVEDGVARVADSLGGLDALINNAGIGMRSVNPHFLSEPQSFWDVSPAGFRDLVSTNLTGYFLMARAVVPRLLTAGSGRIINVTMNHATMVRAGYVPYGPARAGAEALSRIMAADLVDTGVTVNLLLPGGATASGMIPDEVSTEVRQNLLPADIMGPPIRWLCSPQANGIHDQRIIATEFVGPP